MKIEIEGCSLPSGNEFMRKFARRQGYYELNKIKDAWGYRILEALELSGEDYIGNTTRFQVPVIVKLTVYLKNRSKIQDEANLKFAADKLIIDFLKKKRYFVDDSPEYLHWGKIEQKLGMPEKVIVEIEEVK